MSTPCPLCDGVGWTYDPAGTHVNARYADDLLRYPVVRAYAGIPEGTPPLPCMLCNKTEPERHFRGENWLPYFPRWERDAQGDRTSSAEWQADPRARHMVLNGSPVRVTEQGTLERKRSRKEPS